MSRRKRSSLVLERAERRISGLKAISTALDLNNGLTVQDYEQLIIKTRSQLKAYNSLLSSVNAAYNQLLETERSLNDLSELMLLGVASKYGKNSHEYEMAGGTRKSDRKRPARRTNSATAV